MQRSLAIAQRLRAPSTPRQVSCAALHSSIVNAAIAEDTSKAAASLKRTLTLCPNFPSPHRPVTHSPPTPLLKK